MQRFRRIHVIAVGILILVVGAVVWGWRARNGHKWVFRTVLVNRGDLVATIAATGTVEPEEVVDVGAQVAGQIISFGKDKSGSPIDYGSIVEEGIILAQIDDSVYAADVALARAQLEQDKAGEVSAAASLEQMGAKLVQAEADWKRAQALDASRLVTREGYDSSKASYDVARANVSVAEAALTQAKASTVQAEAMLSKAQRNLDFCTIKSPVKGVIIDRRVNIGQTVVSSLNTPSLFLIAKDLTKMQIWVAVNEADVGRIVPGTPVTFMCDAFPGREFEGTVGKVRLNATMTQNVVMYTVEVNAENPERVLLPYLTANVRFVVHNETNVLQVASAALRWTPSSLSEVSPESRSWRPVDAEPTDTGGAQKPSKRDGKPKVRSGTIWLKDGGFVRPVAVTVGASDGVNTIVVAENLAEGREVVIGEEALTTQTGTQNPFVPQIRRR